MSALEISLRGLTVSKHIVQWRSFNTYIQPSAYRHTHTHTYIWLCLPQSNITVFPNNHGSLTKTVHVVKSKEKNNKFQNPEM